MIIKSITRSHTRSVCHKLPNGSEMWAKHSAEFTAEPDDNDDIKATSEGLAELAVKAVKLSVKTEREEIAAAINKASPPPFKGDEKDVHPAKQMKRAGK